MCRLSPTLTIVPVGPMGEIGWVLREVRGGGSCECRTPPLWVPSSTGTLWAISQGLVVSAAPLAPLWSPHGRFLAQTPAALASEVRSFGWSPPFHCPAGSIRST